MEGVVLMTDLRKGIDEQKGAGGPPGSTEPHEPKKPAGLSEDWLSFCLGLLIFLLSLGVFYGGDLLGWGTKLDVWVDPAKALSVVSPAYAPEKGTVVKVEGQKVTIKKSDGKESTIVASEDVSKLKPGDTYEKTGVSGFMSVVYTFLFLLIVMTLAALALRADVPRFLIGFSFVFWIIVHFT